MISSAILFSLFTDAEANYSVMGLSSTGTLLKKQWRILPTRCGAHYAENCGMCEWETRVTLANGVTRYLGPNVCNGECSWDSSIDPTIESPCVSNGTVCKESCKEDSCINRYAEYVGELIGGKCIPVAANFCLVKCHEGKCLGKWTTNRCRKLTAAQRMRLEEVNSRYFLRD